MKAQPSEHNVPLTVRGLIGCIKSVVNVATGFDDKIFLRGSPTESCYREYVAKQKNIHLTEKDLGLDERILGAVFKREGNQTRTGQTLYLIYLSRKIQDPVKRVFVLSHEYAHVLLHGRLMHPGMMLNLSSQDWEPDCIAVKQMEAEANIFALMTILPDKLIDEVQAHSPTKKEVVNYLQVKLINIYGPNGITKHLIEDRLLIHRLSCSQTWNVSLDDVIDTARIRSWIFRDTNYMSYENRFTSN